MEWFDRMKNALDYLERNLEGSIDIEEAAKVAYSSTYHFQRMFHMLTGSTVFEYVRKRRLTLAAQELAIGNIKVIDVALKYGYDSPEAFSKAFRRVHGISPSAAREPGIALKAYPKISFHLSLKGDKDMNYKIVEKEVFKVIGKGKRISTKDEQNFKLVPEFWNECASNGFIDRMCSGEAGEILGICMNDYYDESFTYIIAKRKATDVPLNGEFTEYEIPAATWAVFADEGKMPETIQNVWKRVFSEWFPSTGYEHAGLPEFEVYLDCGTSDADARFEVWIPINKK